MRGRFQSRVFWFSVPFDYQCDAVRCKDCDTEVDQPRRRAYETSLMFTQVD